MDTKEKLVESNPNPSPDENVIGMQEEDLTPVDDDIRREGWNTVEEECNLLRTVPQKASELLAIAKRDEFMAESSICKYLKIRKKEVEQIEDNTDPEVQVHTAWQKDTRMVGRRSRSCEQKKVVKNAASTHRVRSRSTGPVEPQKEPDFKNIMAELEAYKTKKEEAEGLMPREEYNEEGVDEEAMDQEQFEAMLEQLLRETEELAADYCK